MVYVTGNWRVALAGIAASLLIFGVLFFTVIQPSKHTADQAVKTGLQQSQQALDQAQTQLSHAATTASPRQPPSPSPSAVRSQAAQSTGQAKQELSKAAKLASCLSQAGIDTSKIQTCQAN